MVDIYTSGVHLRGIYLMGCVQSYISASRSKKEARKTALIAKTNSDALTKQLHVQWQDIKGEHAILAFEHGVSSGKAMVLDQMKRMEGNMYSSAERSKFRELIRSNTIHSVRMILEALPQLESTLSPHLDNAAATLLSLPKVNRTITQDMADALRLLWQDPVIKEASRRGREFGLNFNADYYLDSIERIVEVNYQPTREDIMRCQVGQTGVMEMSFLAKHFRYKICDMGPQDRNPVTRKYIRGFLDVRAVMFCVNLCDYDQYDQNGSIPPSRMDDALAIFGSICDAAWFRDSDIFVFFTNRDEFVGKLSNSPMSNHFPDYTGGNTPHEAYQYIINRFTELDGYRNVRRRLLTWFISANDPPGRLNKFLVDYFTPRWVMSPV